MKVWEAIETNLLRDKIFGNQEPSYKERKSRRLTRTSQETLRRKSRGPAKPLRLGKRITKSERFAIY